MPSTAISGQGETWQVDSSTPGTPDTEIANIRDWQGFDGESSEIGITNLKSTAKEYLLGLQDFGSVTLNVNPDLADAGQNLLRTAKAAGTTKTFKITFANGWNITFAALVKSAPMSTGVDASLDGSFSLRVTGEPTLATS